ncbi:replication protein [Klebsiella pneumoniae]|nr:replication protein [Klebsiella pneumoniae]
MTDILQNHYSQVKNPNPVFTPREGKKTLPFCRKLMAKAEGFTSRFDFSIHVAFLRSLGKRHRMPPLLRRRAIDALLQAMCFHYDRGLTLNGTVSHVKDFLSDKSEYCGQ